MQDGFDYEDWPIIRNSYTTSGQKLEMAHWEFIPFWICSIYLRVQNLFAVKSYFNKTVVYKMEEANQYEVLFFLNLPTR